MRGIRISVAAGIVALTALLAATPAVAEDPTTCTAGPGPPVITCFLLTSTISDRQVSTVAGQAATVNLDVLQVANTSSVPFPPPDSFLSPTTPMWQVTPCPRGLASVTSNWGDGSTSCALASTRR